MTLAARGPAFLALSTADKAGVCPKTLAITSEADCKYASAALRKRRYVKAGSGDSMAIDCYTTRGEYSHVTRWAQTSDTQRQNPDPSFKTERKAICHAGTLTSRLYVVAFWTCSG